MKGLFKLTSVALAVVAFASCSSDDLFHQGETAQQNKGILVEVEDMLDPTTTRAAYMPDGKIGNLIWNDGDQIRVTDATMVKYDIFSFSESLSAFIFNPGATGRSAYLTEPKYAAFADLGLAWENTKLQSEGYYNIPANFAWGEDVDNEGAYYARLPLWGTAQTDETYGIKASLKYLTGILKMNMVNLPANITNIKIVGWKNLAGTDPAPISGNFKAILATDDVLNDEAVLEDYGATTGNEIDVDVRWATKAQSVIFLPLIAQRYGMLQIQYSDDYGTTYTTKKTIENLTVERRKFYNFTDNTIKFGGTSASSISAVLEEKKAEDEITIEMGKDTKLTNPDGIVGNDDDDYTITIPETSASKITLSFNNLLNQANAPALNIVSKGDFAGTLVINVVGTPTISNIKFNLPLANVVFNDCQNLGGVDLGENIGGGLDNVANALVAKTLTINAKTNLNGIYANAELGNRNTDGTADFKMVKGSTVNVVEFETNYKTKKIELCGTLTNNLDMTTWKDKDNKFIACTAEVGNGANIQNLTITGDVTVTGGTMGNLVTDGNVTIKGVTAGSGASATTAGTVASVTPFTNPSSNVTTSIVLEEEGTITGDITPVGRHTYNLELKGKASVGGTAGTATVNSLTIAGTTANVNNVIVIGNATISNTGEGEAVKGTITMNATAAARTLTLNGGYVNTIAKSGSRNLTIQHGTDANYTAIASITAPSSGKIIIDKNTKSVWNGKKIGEYASGMTAAQQAAQDALKTTYATGITKIYTANQLATSNAAAELWSNIDLAGLAFNGPALAGNFEGKDMDPATSGNQFPTIENLNLAAAANNSTGNIDGVGLFSTAATAATLKNFTVKNVTSTITEANNKNVTSVGTLVGSATANIIVESVTIQNAVVGNTIADNIGGLIGKTNANIELNKVNVSGLTLNGRFYIGGVVGLSTGSAITINASNTTRLDVTAINVPATFNAEPDIKTLAELADGYGSVGMIAGQSGVAVTDASQKLIVENDLIKGNRQRLGYKMYYKNAGPNVKYYYGRRGDDHTKKHVYVGRITTDFTDPTSFTEVTDKATFTNGWDTPTQCMIIKHDIYDECDQ